MKNKSIWFITLIYSSDKNALFEQKKIFKNFSHIFVDNNQDNANYIKGVDFMKTQSNLGYAGGMNKGIRYCLENGADWLIVLNDDIFLTKQSILSFFEELIVLRSGVIGPFGGSLDPKRWTTILPAKGNVDYISGSCMAIHKDVLKKIGNFYEPYFLYYEDVDLCMRAKRAGFPIIHVPIKGIEHDEKESVKKGTKDREYYLARNHLLFVERSAPIKVKLYELLRLPKTIGEHMVKKEWGALAGIRDYFLRRFGPRTQV